MDSTEERSGGSQEKLVPKKRLSCLFCIFKSGWITYMYTQTLVSLYIVECSLSFLTTGVEVKLDPSERNLQQDLPGLKH